jgi:CHAT domain-containing protein
VFVTAGNLQYVPFGALSNPVTRRPLLVDHEVVAAPSASVLVSLRERRAVHAAAKTLLIFADPVFTADDPRVQRPAAGAPTATSAAAVSPALTRSLSVLGDDSRPPRLDRLIGSRREANAIARLLPANAFSKEIDFDASREAFIEQDDRYRIVHFATHALLNNEHPELSGIVLSLVDRNGQPKNGYLGMAEVFNLKLDAQLVVLSACQTALGRNVRGEGLLGLSRAFMYAGTPRVVATTWKVDDAATAALMQRFYEGMFGAAKLSPAAALRAAQIYIRRQPRWRAPYYWAPFVIQGDWR